MNATHAIVAVPSPSPTRGPSLGEQAGTSVGYWMLVVGLILIIFVLRIRYGAPGRGRNDW